MYYKIKHDSEYLQQIMTVYKWYERLVIYTLTIQSECPTGKHKTDPKTIQTFTQLAVHFTAQSLVSDYHYASLLNSSTQNHTTVNQNIIQNDNTQLVHNPGQ